MQVDEITANSPRDSGAVPGTPLTLNDEVLARCTRWLNTQCAMISQARAGSIITLDTASATTVCDWQDGPSPEQPPLDLLRAAVQEQQPRLLTGSGEGESRILQPVPALSDIVVILDVGTDDEAQLRVIRNLIGWGAEWLGYTLQQPAGTEHMVLGEVFPLVAICLDQPDFHSLATTLVTELAQRFNCQRVSLGIRRRRQTEVVVLSHSARIKHDANLLRGISLAMDESIDQDRVVLHAGESSTEEGLHYAHAALARETGDGCILSLPFNHHGSALGAMTLERASGTPFDRRTVEMLERVLAVLAPVMLLMRQDEMGLVARIGRSINRSGKALLGSSHYVMKLSAVAALILAIFLSSATGEWRVTADAVIEGSVQRTIAAPIDGFIKSAEARAGDVVDEGQLLGTLDDNDLKLERLKWATLRQQMVSESRDAAARRDRAEVSIIAARIDQADAELLLLDEQLSRTRILAPFAGVVIEGDLSQRLGTPVSRGDSLFVVAPLDGYRVVLKVGEGDIASLAGGETGALVLASMPSRRFPLQVERITAVSTAEGGANAFRVEATLDDMGENLRPGMEGVGKIELGEANLAWIWSRDLLAWLRLKTWSWWR